jgi:hypothetical protein
MTDDASRLSDIHAHPTYHASLRLACGAIARVTVLDDEILTDICDHDGRLVSARMTADEAGEVAGMLHAAERIA